jgi:hypothetical protein
MQPNEIVQAARIRLYLGIVGVAMPSNLTTPGAGFFDVGLTNPESCRFRVSPSFERVMAHQSDFPVKIIETPGAGGIDVDLLQWNANNFRSVFGGGRVERVTGSETLYRFVPARLGGRGEVSAVLDVIYGAKTYRFLSPRLFNEAETELELNQSPEAKLPLRLSILGGDDVDAWSMITNDPAFEPAETGE